VAPYGGELATDHLELCGRRGESVDEQRLLGGRCRNAGDRADLRVRQATVAQRGVDARQAGERVRDPDVLTPGTRRPTDPPRQPRGAGHRAIVGPVARLVEHTDVCEQSMHGSVEVEGVLGDPLAQLRPRDATGRAAAAFAGGVPNTPAATTPTA